MGREPRVVPKKQYDVRHTDLSDVQKLIITAHAAIEATLVEQAQTMPKLRRRHLLMLLACKQANLLHPWFRRKEVKELITAMQLPVSIVSDMFTSSYSLLIEYQLINPLNIPKHQFSIRNFVVSRYGLTILTRISQHHNRILREYDTGLKDRRKTLNSPLK